MSDQLAKRKAAEIAGAPGTSLYSPGREFRHVHDLQVSDTRNSRTAERFVSCLICHAYAVHRITFAEYERARTEGRDPFSGFMQLGAPELLASLPPELEALK